MIFSAYVSLSTTPCSKPASPQGTNHLGDIREKAGVLILLWIADTIGSPTPKIVLLASKITAWWVLEMIFYENKKYAQMLNCSFQGDCSTSNFSNNTFISSHGTDRIGNFSTFKSPSSGSIRPQVHSGPFCCGIS